MAIDVGTAVAYLDLNMTSFNTGLQTAQSALKTFVDESSTMGDKLMGAGSVVANLGSSITRNLSAPLANLGVSSINAYRDFESAFAGVKKTIDDTRFKEYSVTWDDLSNAIKQMAQETGISAEEIAGVMEVAGQLGVELGDGGKNIIEFTRQMTMLGVATDMTAQDASLSLARFANITGLFNTTTDESAKNVEGLGSAITALGNNFATQEAEIVNMSTRLASAGTVSGLTAQEILALATAMSSAGIRAEAGGSSMSTTLTNLEQIVQGVAENAEEKLETLGYISGMGAAQFAETWKNDPIKAIEAFIRGLGNVNTEGESMVLFLDELGMKSIRQSNMLRALALSADNMSEALQVSNSTWNDAYAGTEKGSALVEEFNKRLETMDSRLNMLNESWKDVKRELAEMLLPLVEKLIEKAKELMEWWKGLDDGTKNLIVSVGKFIVVAGPITMLIGKIVTGIGGLVKAIEIIKGIGIVSRVKQVNDALKIGTLVMGDVVDNSNVANLAVGKLAGAFNLATDSTNIFSNGVGIVSQNTAVMTQGVGLAEGAVTSCGSSLVTLGGSASKAGTEVGNAGAKIAEAGGHAEGAVPKVNGFTNALMKIGGFTLAAVGVVGAIATIKDAVENGCTAIHVAVLALMGALVGVGVALMAGASALTGGIVGIVVGALVGLGILIFQHLEEIKGFFKNFGETLKRIFQGALDVIAWIWDHTFGLLIKAAQWLKNKLFGDPIIVDIANAMVQWFTFMGNMMKTLFEGAVNAVISIATFLKDTIGGLIEAAVNIIVGAFNMMKDGILSVVENVKNKVMEFAGLLKSGFENAKEVVVSFFGNMLQRITEWKDKWVARAKEAASAFVNSFKEKTKSAIAFFGDFFSSALNFIKNKAGDFASAGSNLISKFTSAFKSGWESLQNWVGNAVNGLSNAVNGVVSGIKNVANGVKNVASNVANKVKSVVNGRHKDGLDYVPFDGYIAELHKGERVLTAQENASYSGIGGSTINFYSNEKIDEYTAARELKRAVKDINLGLV